MRTLHVLVLATTLVGLCAEEEEKCRLSHRRCPAMDLRMMRCREDAIVDQLHLSLTPERFAVCNHGAGVHSGCPQHDTIQGIQRVCFVLYYQYACTQQRTSTGTTYTAIDLVARTIRAT